MEMKTKGSTESHLSLDNQMGRMWLELLTKATFWAAMVGLGAGMLAALFLS